LSTSEVSRVCSLGNASEIRSSESASLPGQIRQYTSRHVVIVTGAANPLRIPSIFSPEETCGSFLRLERARDVSPWPASARDRKQESSTLAVINLKAYAARIETTVGRELDPNGGIARVHRPESNLIEL
jgi:hypothetical protein